MDYPVHKHGRRLPASLRTFYHQILLPLAKVRRTAVSAYADLICDIITSDR
ncbi:hypothetical protein EUBSIR_02769 [[Eubacterium] siraeum DSM 15702]|uniref:Uncharacterized protein n=1 Tax=[Eubacterium] siraeum DSM 15702 TaxID=428128 RepID=B0MSC9_9FIRM|nr:hypothetical protein EUBSIR_02769 [[Eubacterium] siraeum DSM 15702]